MTAISPTSVATFTAACNEFASFVKGCCMSQMPELRDWEIGHAILSFLSENQGKTIVLR